MIRYIARRLLFLIPIWVGVSIAVFVLMRIMPGDVAAAMLGEEGVASEEQLDAVRRSLGLDEPLYIQYLDWIQHVATFDLGNSLYGNVPVTELIWSRLPATLNLAILASLISIVIGIPLGVISAVKRNTPIDYITRFVSILGLAIPPFWLGILVIVFLAVYFNYGVPFNYVLPWEDPWLNIQKMIWPALILGYEQSALIARMTRSAMLDTLAEDYVRTAYAKGLRGRAVVMRHALRNALIPVVTVIGVYFALMLGGTVVLEPVFNIPGLGSLLFESIRRRDYPVIEILLLFSVTVVLVVNVFVEATYAWIDPRISHG